MPGRGSRAGALVEPEGQFALRGLDGIRAVNEVLLHLEPPVATGAREGEGEVVFEGVTGGGGPLGEVGDFVVLVALCQPVLVDGGALRQLIVDAGVGQVARFARMNRTVERTVVAPRLNCLPVDPGADVLGVELLSYGYAGLPQPRLVSSDDRVGGLDESDGTRRDSRNMRPGRPGRPGR